MEKASDLIIKAAAQALSLAARSGSPYGRAAWASALRSCRSGGPQQRRGWRGPNQGIGQSRLPREMSVSLATVMLRAVDTGGIQHGRTAASLALHDGRHGCAET